MSVALSSYDSLAQRHAALTALHRLILRLPAEQGLTATLRAVTEGIVDGLGFGTAVVNVVSDDGDLEVAAVAGDDEARAALLGHRGPRADWDAMLAAADTWGRLRFLDHRHDGSTTGAVPVWVPSRQPGVGTGAWHPDDALLAPMVSPGGTLTGVLSVDRPVSGMRPDPEQLELLEMFAAQAQLAIENARLLDAVQQTQREQLRERVAQQSAVAVLGQQALSGAGLPTLLRSVVRSVAGTLSVPLVSVHQLDARGSTLRIRAGTGWSGHDLGHRFAADSDTPAGRAMTSARPCVLADLDADDAGVDAALCRSYGVRSSACVLIGKPEHPWGALAAHSRAPARFDPDDVAFLQSVANVVASAVDRRQAESAVRHRAQHDGLTGLANRTLFEAHVTRRIRRRERDGTQVGLLLFDLDGFKDVNDFFGHDSGDRLLTELASRLRRVVRRTDGLARLGGDEFAVCLPRVSSPHAAAEAAQRVRATVEEPFDLSGTPVRLSASVGCALAPAHGTDYPTLLRRADIAMYRAKTFGTGAAVYEPDVDESPSSRLVTLAALRDAIGTDQLALYYQPVVDLASGRVDHVEALLRWRHPDRGMLCAGAFIPLVEQTDLIAPLTLWVLREASTQVAKWQAEDLQLPVAVNLSGTSFGDLALPGAVAAAAREAGIPTGLLSIEVTESALAHPDAGRALRQLGDLGVHATVDDFGVGYASLAYLKHLTLHRLKIDREFVTRLAEDRTDDLIVRSVVDLAHGLGLQVVAEGIEDERAAARSRQLGIEFGQGFHLAKPMPVDVLRRWLGDERRSSLS